MFPFLETERYLLQEIKPEDQQFIYEGLSHPEIIPFYGISYSSYDETTAQMTFYKELTENGNGAWWKIVDKTTTENIGAVGYNNYHEAHKKAEIGYWLLPRFWKKGIISEVLPSVIHYLQENIGIHRIESLIEEGNEASCRIMEKLGFGYEGKMRDCEIKNGKYISLHIYSLITEGQMN